MAGLVAGKAGIILTAIAGLVGCAAEQPQSQPQLTLPTETVVSRQQIMMPGDQAAAASSAPAGVCAADQETPCTTAAPAVITTASVPAAVYTPKAGLELYQGWIDDAFTNDSVDFSCGPTACTFADWKSFAKSAFFECHEYDAKGDLSGAQQANRMILVQNGHPNLCAGYTKAQNPAQYRNANRHLTVLPNNSAYRFATGGQCERVDQDVACWNMGGVGFIYHEDSDSLSPITIVLPEPTAPAEPVVSEAPAQ